MFILSVDSLSPHYLDSQDDDELHQAVTFGDSVLIVQNKQILIPCTHATSVKPSVTSPDVERKFNGRKYALVSWNGRNPLQPALDAFGRIILGMGTLTQHTSISKHSHSKTHLVPLRVSSVRYSDLELVL